MWTQKVLLPVQEDGGARSERLTVSIFLVLLAARQAIRPSRCWQEEEPSDHGSHSSLVALTFTPAPADEGERETSSGRAAAGTPTGAGPAVALSSKDNVRRDPSNAKEEDRVAPASTGSLWREV